MNGLIFGIERVCIIWLGALLVLEKQFSVGMLFAFLAYKDQFSSRLAALIDRAFEIKTLRVHGDRIADIVFTAPEPEQKSGNIDLDRLTPSIELKNICFRYSNNDPWVLQDINCKIEAGECVALTGPSGCGKTTLVKIILGLIAPTKGEILIGGTPLDAIGPQQYRRLAATVMQDDTLFSGTIGENISFFCPDVDDEFVSVCATRAAIHKEIVRMPMKYNSVLGNIGSSLSGGQRQRILLARALYQRPKILVLDEATSHLDLGNEESINEYIKEINLTRIIVAHRPETIAVADRTIFMQAGRIVDGVTPTASLHLAGASR
jgi:ATP-binding cassette subfamily B protein RaxB